MSADMPADPSPQLGLEARLAARVRRSPGEFHAAAEAAQRLWGQADWQPQSRCCTMLSDRSSVQHVAAMMKQNLYCIARGATAISCVAPMCSM